MKNSIIGLYKLNNPVTKDAYLLFYKKTEK